MKLNSKGITHFLIPLIVVVIGVAAFGTYKLVSSSADRNYGTVQLAGDGAGKRKSVISQGGKVRTVTDLETLVSCERKNTCSKKHMSAKIGGKKANLKCSSNGDCTIAVRVNGNQGGKTFSTKVYVKGKVVASKSLKFYAR